LRLALGISYNGQAYEGWQSQPLGPHRAGPARSGPREVRQPPGTIGTLCAGRTDAGVHGLMQVVHFDTEVEREPFSWVRGTNRFLPDDIAVQWAQPCPTNSMPRQRPGRRYLYVLLESPVRPSVDAGRVGWVFRPLDGDAMRKPPPCSSATHDFSSFRASACQAKSPVKTCAASRSRACGPYWRFEFEADAFLHHMIRNLMGCLVRIGRGDSRRVDLRGARGAQPQGGRPDLLRPTACTSWARCTTPSGVCRPRPALHWLGSV
jgi:tRNA pseudouridine38-40 synthase